MLFIILGLSLFEIITGIVLKKGVPYTTFSSKCTLFYDINQNNTNKIINGTVHIYYSSYILHPFNYLYLAETTDYDKYNDNGNTKLYFDLHETGNETNELTSNFTFIPTSKKSNAIRLRFDINTFLIYNITITVNEIGNILILENDISQNITNLLMGQLYYFLIFVEKRKNANISLSMNYNNKQPFKYLTICEHSSLNSKLQYTLKNDNQISFNKVEDEYTINLRYIISLINSKYISLEIIPQHNIDYINVKIDFGGKITFISSPNTQFNNLIPGYNYGFYMNAREKQLAKFNITMNYMENIPFEYITILEISKSYEILKKTKENVKSKYMKINDTYVISLEFIIWSYETNLISLEIDLKYDIENLTLYKQINGGTLECENGKEYRLQPILGYPYYLFIGAKEKQKVSPKGLYMVLSNRRIINDIYIYEFSYRNSSSYNIYQRITDLDKDFSYEIKNKTTNYVAFCFEQVNILSPIYVGLEVKDGDFDCINGTKSEFGNLLKNNNYYFYINATVNKYVSINITMNQAYKNSVEYMTIYEYSERYNSDILKETQQNITIKSSKYDAFSYNSYKVISNYTNYVCFKIHTKENAKYFIQIFVKDFNDSYSGVPDDKDDGESESSDKKSKSENKTESDENKSQSDINKSEREEKPNGSSLGTTSLVMIILGSIISLMIIIFIALFILRKSNKEKSSDIINIEYSPIQNNINKMN